MTRSVVQVAGIILGMLSLVASVLPWPLHVSLLFCMAQIHALTVKQWCSVSRGPHYLPAQFTAKASCLVSVHKQRECLISVRECAAIYSLGARSVCLVSPCGKHQVLPCMHVLLNAIAPNISKACTGGGMQFIYGYGVGGEYAVAASSAAERAEGNIAMRARRGELIVCTFAMQARPESVTFAS